MCGVVGFTGGSASEPQRIETVRRGIRAIVHRGPEEAGYYDDPRFTLGTVRLCLVDQPLGKQPMITPDGRFVLGFNGEIFNFVELRDELESRGIRLATRSDTEVLLHSLAYWGVDEALGRLQGQFAFAFYDRARRELILGRDPFGERPLFYAVIGSACYFASEIKGLFAVSGMPRRISLEGVRAAARFWAPIPDETCFEGVRCLAQGHYARVRDGRLDVVKYDNGFERGGGEAGSDGMTFDAGKEELRRTLRESVRLRLRGDYPVGTFLSGGLDSAVVTALATRLLGRPVRTFSIRMELPAYDESRQQEVVAKALGTEHSSLLVTGADVRERFPKVIEQCEMILFKAAPVACGMLAKHVGASGVRIVLGGEGADEQFLGYDITKEAAFLQRGLDADACARLMAAFTDMRHTSSEQGDEVLRFHRLQRGLPGAVLGAHLRRFEGEPLDWMAQPTPGAPSAEERLLGWIRGQAPGFDGWSHVERTQWLDIHTLFIGYGMPCHGDRPGAGFGVETRFPFTDPTITRLAARLPQDWKLHEGVREKHILREAFAADLPAEIANRPKFAMRLPGAGAMRRTGADDWVAEVLGEASFRSSAIVAPEAARQLVARVEAFPGDVPYPYSHQYLKLLSALLLERTFVREFKVPDVDVDRIMFKRVRGDVDLPQAAAR